MLNKYLKCSVWRLALRYDIYVYVFGLYKRLNTHLHLAMRLKKSRVIPLHPTRSLYGSYSVNFIIVIIIIAYMRALFQNGAQKDRGSHDPLHLCYKTALFSHNRLQLHHTTCCSPRYKWSSTGSSSTSNSLTMLGWCSFFSIAISLYTLSRGFTDDLILLGAARPATTQ